MSIFKLPDLGEGLPDAEIHEWFAKEGETVKTDQLLVSMETAKAIVEVPAPQSGKIVKLYGKPGDIIKTGAPLVEFDSDDATLSKQDKGTVVGNIESRDVTVEESFTIGAAATSPTSKVKATPAVRALARRLQVDLNQIQASGNNGLITLDDVEQAAGGASSPAVATSTEPPKGYEALHGARRSMAITMAKSHAEVVPVTIYDDADIFHWAQDSDITINLIQAMVIACSAEAALNAWYDTASMSCKLMTDINIGLAVDTGKALFVPVIKDTANKSAADLRAVVNKFKQGVRDRNIPQQDLHDATITLSNFGNFAGRYANPIIVPPTVAILGVGRIRDEVVAVNGKPAVHRILPLSLTFDHRAVTGGEATRFLGEMIKALQASE